MLKLFLKRFKRICPCLTRTISPAPTNGAIERTDVSKECRDERNGLPRAVRRITLSGNKNTNPYYKAGNWEISNKNESPNAPTNKKDDISPECSCEEGMTSPISPRFPSTIHSNEKGEFPSIHNQSNDSPIASIPSMEKCTMKNRYHGETQDRNLIFALAYQNLRPCNDDLGKSGSSSSACQ